MYFAFLHKPDLVSLEHSHSLRGREYCQNILLFKAPFQTKLLRKAIWKISLVLERGNIGLGQDQWPRKNRRNVLKTV